MKPQVLFICAVATIMACSAEHLDDPGQDTPDPAAPSDQVICKNIDDATLCADAKGRILNLNGHMPSAAALEQVAVGDRIVNQGIGAVVQPAGESVIITVDNEDETSAQLKITTNEDGSISIDMESTSDTQSAIALAPSSPAACQDGAYKLNGHKWFDTFVWRFNASSVPSGLDVNNVEQRLQEAAINITSSRNSCGLPDIVTARQHYAGRTSLSVNMYLSGGTLFCGNPDGHSTVDFGDMGSSALGGTCTWPLKGGPAKSSDVRLNKNRSWFATDAVPTGCNGQHAIEQTATHEFGHTFGLDHVKPQDEHANLTMSPKGRPCSIYKTTLGWGDWRGLNKLYGDDASASDISHAPASAPFWRYYNPGNKDHYYVTSRDDVWLANQGWHFEGNAGYLFNHNEENTVPIYRYWHAGIGDHFYTTNWAELGGGAAGWAYEGIAGYIFPLNYLGTVPVYRYWSGIAGDHFYTTNWAELGGGNGVYVYEGVLGYVYP